MISPFFYDYTYMGNSRIQFHHVSGDTPEEILRNRQSILVENWPDRTFGKLFSNRLDLNQVMTKNCENMIGTVEVPVGIAGPVAVNLEEGELELWMPLATTEGALVASVSRGMKLLRENGTVTILTEKKGMSRAPVFECPDGQAAFQFAHWLETQHEFIKQQASQLSTHFQFLQLYSWVQGRHVFVRFHFDTQEAMGMNMVTIYLEKVIQQLLSQFPQVKLLAITSNLCTDKKPAYSNKLLGRGWWAQAETVLSHDVIENNLHTSSVALTHIHTQKNLVGSHLAGALSQNAHFANVAAAFYLATGQDLAHTVNASVGTLTIEPVEHGLYVAATLPEIDVGTVGGGTVLQPQTQARQLICRDQHVNITARLLASTLAVGCLAAELSLLGAIATKELGKAHQKLGRGNK